MVSFCAMERRMISRLAALFVVLTALIFGGGEAFKLSSQGCTLPLCGAGKGVVGTAACTPGSEATAFLARTSGLDAAHTTAYCNLANCQVSAGTWALKDFQYIFATQDTTTAQLNLISTSFAALLNGSPNFSADNGYLGVDASSTVYIDTQFKPSTAGGNLTQNSSHYSAWSLTNATSTASGGSIIGAVAAGQRNEIYPKYLDGNAYGDINSSLFSAGVASSDSRGQFLINRSGASATQFYQNASSVLTESISSSALVALNVFILATNLGVPGTGGGYRIAMASGGGSFTSMQVTDDYNCLRAYMTAVGVP